MELRLQKRYRHLVESHLNVLQAVAAGIKAIPGVEKSFAATQAAWRFFRNPNVRLGELIGPLQDVGHLDQVLSWMDQSNSWNLGRRPVFVIDREADSVKHLRAWDAAGHLFLVRADDRRLSFRGGSQLLSEVALTLQRCRSQRGITGDGASKHFTSC